MTESAKNEQPPKVFISYSHDSEEHKAWVLQLATRLTADGVDVVLDQWDIHLGGDLPHFMERGLSGADRILAICSTKYVNKANQGKGGVGYEKTILTGKLMKKVDSNKIIPVLRDNKKLALPTFLSGKLYKNFNENSHYETAYEELIREIHNTPSCPKPPIGKNPFTGNPPHSPKPAFSPARYVSPALEGTITFDYSNNNGSYVLGSGDLSFTTKWSKASDTSIHAYSAGSDIDSIALVKDKSEITQIDDAEKYDNSSRCRTASLGQIVIWKNKKGYFCATKVEAITDDSRGAKEDSLTFFYKILGSRKADFSVS